MSEQPEQDDVVNPPAPPGPVTRPPLIDRVSQLEDRLAQLTQLHNKLANDASRELGL